MMPHRRRLTKNLMAVTEKISGSDQAVYPAALAAKSSTPERIRQKKTERSQALSRRFGQEPAPVIPKNVRQDVQAQSHQIHSSRDRSEQSFQFWPIFEIFAEIYGFQSTRQFTLQDCRVYCLLFNLHLESQIVKGKISDS